MQPGILGLGKMGGDLALQCMGEGIDVVGHSERGHPALAAKSVRVLSTYDAFVGALKPPGMIYLSLPAGPAEGFAVAEPVLKKLAVEDGLLYTVAPGSGHFVKLVHNGIGFGMNHAIGEGVELLRHGYDGHPFGEDEAIAKERKTSRITKIWG